MLFPVVIVLLGEIGFKQVLFLSLLLKNKIVALKVPPENKRNKKAKKQAKALPILQKVLSLRAKTGLLFGIKAPCVGCMTDGWKVKFVFFSEMGYADRY